MNTIKVAKTALTDLSEDERILSLVKEHRTFSADVEAAFSLAEEKSRQAWETWDRRLKRIEVSARRDLDGGTLIQPQACLKAAAKKYDILSSGKLKERVTSLQSLAPHPNTIRVLRNGVSLFQLGMAECALKQTAFCQHAAFLRSIKPRLVSSAGGKSDTKTNRELVEAADEFEKAAMAADATAIQLKKLATEYSDYIACLQNVLATVENKLSGEHAAADPSVSRPEAK